MSIWDFIDGDDYPPTPTVEVPQLYLIIWTPTGQAADYLRDSELLSDADQIGPRIAALQQRHPGQRFTAVAGDYLPWARGLPMAPTSTDETADHRRPEGDDHD